MRGEPAAMTPEEYQLLNEFLAQRFGIHFPQHKKEILESRLKPRLADLRLAGFMDYYFLLQYGRDGASEVINLLSHITNNETYFFRETHQFAALFGPGLKLLRGAAQGEQPLRILCAGCSSGEEPHTLNIFARENQYRMWGQTVLIDAFDVDEERIVMARKAEYGASSVRIMEPEAVERYFVTGAPGRHQLKPLYRQNVSFALGNIVEVETYRKAQRYDALFCRNVLIYFSEPALHRAIDNFAQVLRPGGLLFLGHSESIIGLSAHFEPERLENCIVYRRVGR